MIKIMIIIPLSQVEQLDDALIFLATLPCKSFVVARSIFQMYSKGKLKGQKVPKSKEGPF